ncbi:MAG: DNA topoisomerase, partial [Oscillospiraceae bacterium]
KRQSVVNERVHFILKDQTGTNTFETYEYYYENGITDYVKELTEEQAFSSVQLWQSDERKGRDRADMKDYKVKINVALCFSNKKQIKEYHNSSFLEYGGAPEKAVRSAFVSQIDAYLKANSKYLKSDGKISFQDIEDCLVIVVSSFSTQTSYENQTKKAINNKFIYDAMTEFLKHQIEVYFLENPDEANKICEQ